VSAPGLRRKYASLVILLWLALYVPGLWSPPLLDDADSLHAEAAREMMLRHDWSTLYINGLRYLEKAPLLYWGMATSYHLFGQTDWAARLPLALSVLALLLITFRIGSHHFDEAAGLYAAMALGLSFGLYIYTRILIPDALVALWLMLSLHFFLRGLEEPEPSRLSCWGLAACTALNVLTKGLIGVVFPILIIGAYLLLTGNLRHLLRIRLVSSAAIFFAIAAPWHIVAGLRNPAAGASRGFFWFYFINEHVLRYTKHRYPRDYDTVPLLLFLSLTLLFLLPWSAFAFKALGDVPHRISQLKSLDRRGRALLLFAIAVFVVVGFFSFSSRQEYYVLPIVPALALILGDWLSREQSSPSTSPLRRAGVRIALVSFIVAVPLALAAWAALWFSQAVPPHSELADLLTRNPSEYALSFGHVFDLTPRAMGKFRPELLMMGIALFGGTLASWQLRRHKRAGTANAALALMMLVALLCVHSALITFSPILSSRTLANALAPIYRPGDVIVVNGADEDASTLSFYGHLPLHVLNSRGVGNLYYGSLFPDSPAVFEDDQSLERLWRGEGRVFVLTQQTQIPPLLQHSSYISVARSGGKLILANHL